ncbi:hypothetical protein BC835DRAFT_1371871 [Cytidiella melzeri]|nr:hypothetical protein BC835DRAFT_1371871 [Cytidiella melzeri]
MVLQLALLNITLEHPIRLLIMRFTTSLILFSAIVTGSFHTVAVSAMPHGRRSNVPLGNPDNFGGLSTGKDTVPTPTTRALEADYGEFHLNDRSNAAGQQHQARQQAFARDDVPTAVLHARAVPPLAGVREMMTMITERTGKNTLPRPPARGVVWETSPQGDRRGRGKPTPKPKRKPKPNPNPNPTPVPAPAPTPPGALPHSPPPPRLS